MAETVECDIHGEQSQAFVCVHLLGDDCTAGFNSDVATDDYPFPDAWCDNCEIIRTQHDGWNKANEDLAQIKLVCSRCYCKARARNTKPEVTLDELFVDAKWKCGSCEEWHTGPILDVSHDTPYYWTEEMEAEHQKNRLLPSQGKKPKTWRDNDYCVIDGEDFFVRGLIHVPVIGTNETFCFGVWGSLSKDNFENLYAMDDDPKRVEIKPMFSWLSSSIKDYPETLSLKMSARVLEPRDRPIFELDYCDHPLAQDFQNGILPTRVKEITEKLMRA
jgi:hypothetical protein